MVADASRLEWRQSQDALRTEVGRVTALLRSIEDPCRGSVVGGWDLSEVAMHLSQAWLGIPGLARGDRSAFDALLPERAGVAGDSLVRDVADLGDVTTQLVRADPERQLSVLANRIDDAAKQYFADCTAATPEALRPWLMEGISLPLTAFTGHLLNETMVHGYDIARAAGRPWRVNADHAALLVDGFFVPLIEGAGPRTLVNADTAAGVRATFDVHIRSTSHFHRHFVFDDGDLRVEKPSARRVDCHLSAHPVAFLLLFWDRQSQWQAIARGQLMAWGRRPWLAARFRSLLNTP
ncbi:MAG: hypothetical protein M3137_01900 [Actinomycetota bacterium]|nr:hypothetical protein [Actinomycetota bacterium]